jgi:hypothetical protein
MELVHSSFRFRSIVVNTGKKAFRSYKSSTLIICSMRNFTKIANAKCEIWVIERNNNVTMADQEKKTQTKKRAQLGKLPRRYRFFLNPYQDVRFTSCPQCANKTRQRKLPLFIHVSPAQPVTLNKTCRYCPTRDLLIAHQDDLEDVLPESLLQKYSLFTSSLYFHLLMLYTAAKVS